MMDFEPISTEIKHCNDRKYALFWIYFLCILFFLFSLFFFCYPIATFHTYEGYIVKEENYVVKLYIPQEKFPNLNQVSFYVEREKRKFQIQKIQTSLELGMAAGYLEVTLDLNLKKEEKIEANRLQVTILEKEETLFQRWKSTWKERVDLWLS